MAIADLLWACPRCRTDRGIRPADSGETCSQCGTRYDRVRGAAIRAVDPGGEEEVRTPAEWVDRLPPLERLLDAGDPVRRARVAARFVERHEIVRDRTHYLNRIEIFGAETEGTLELRLERLILRRTGKDPVVWDFAALRAVQASSRTLQINGAPHPLASFRFLDDSSFLWEHLLEAALRRFYRDSGRGEIVELQPRITTR